MRILLIASAVGKCGDGITGGVSDVLLNTAAELSKRGHSIDILAPQGSQFEGTRIIGILGNYQPTLALDTQLHQTYPVPPDSLIGNYWYYVRQHQQEYDVIINFCHDWLPYYLTPFIHTPVLHQANLPNLNAAVTDIIQTISATYPNRVAALSRAQANALGIGDHAFICPTGIDVNLYTFSDLPEKNTLGWFARVSPEKGLEDAAEIACRAEKKLLVCGFMQDQDYFNDIQKRYGDVIEYLGFLDKSSLSNAMGRAEALLCTHKWVEAFGQVVIEALASGTPVITYNRGGPAEIVRDGETGFIVEADNIQQAVDRVSQVPSISRQHCRRACEVEYSLKAYGDRLEKWLKLAMNA